MHVDGALSDSDDLETGPYQCDAHGHEVEKCNDDFGD